MLVVLFCIIPLDDIIVSQSDVQHVNHVYDDDGKFVFIQVMYEDWRYNAYHVEDWRMAKSPHLRPVYNHGTRRWEALWWDGDQLRKTVSTAFRESWTQYDAEVENRKLHPVECRKKLPRIRHATEGR